MKGIWFTLRKPQLPARGSQCRHVLEAMPLTELSRTSPCPIPAKDTEVSIGRPAFMFGPSGRLSAYSRTFQGQPWRFWMANRPSWSSLGSRPVQQLIERVAPLCSTPHLCSLRIPHKCSNLLREYRELAVCCPSSAFSVLSSDNNTERFHFI